MLVKIGFEGIKHFENHAEMLPHVGRKFLFVGECVNLLGNFFADKAEKFLNWYDEPTAKNFEGLSDSEWRAAKVYFDVRLTICRNYDKYAEPKPQRIMDGEDEKAFEIFQQILKVIEPREIFVMSKNASDSIKKFFTENLPENIHLFDSEFPSQWTEENYKKFVAIIENLATEKAKYHLKNWTLVTGRKNFLEVA